MLKPALARGEFRIGATTITEYQSILKRCSLSGVYPLRVDELAKDTVKVLESLKPKLENYYQITNPRKFRTSGRFVPNTLKTLFS